MSNFSLWLMMSLVTPFLWAINNVFDRAMINRVVKNEYVLTFMCCMIRLPFFLILFGLSGWAVPPLGILLVALLAGFFQAFPILFYLKAFEKADTPATILMYDVTNPMFVLLLATVFLGERLTGTAIPGFILLLLAGVLASYRFGEKIRFHRRIWWIVLAAGLWAPADVLFSWLIPHFPSLTGLNAWIYLGGFLTGFLFLASSKFRSRCKLQDFRWPARAWGIFFFINATVLISYFVFLKALSLEKVSLTIVLTNIQPFFVFMIELFLFRWVAIIDRPDTRFKTVLPKILALGLVFAGVWLLHAH